MTNKHDPVEERRGAHLGRHLIQASRAFNQHAASRLRAAGHSEVTVSHLGLLPHLARGGSRLSDLAERTGMTKQAVGQLVADLERLHYVTRAADPNDRRAVRILFTGRGRKLLADGLGITEAMDERLRQRIGPTRYQQFIDTLAAIAEGAAWPDGQSDRCGLQDAGG